MARRPRISEDFVEIHRRRRYVEAAAEILHEFGRPGLTATNVVRLAGGSRGSFYQTFEGVEGCLACGIRLAEGELFAGMPGMPDDSGEKDWLAEVYEAISCFFEAVVSRPLLAELFLIHSAAARSVEGGAAFRSGGERFVALIRRGSLAAESLNSRPTPDLIAECLSRGIVEVATRRVRSEQLANLTEESRSLTLMVGGFYLGAQVAEESLSLQPTA
jgi:AcrR family transcriptional regulator